MGMIDQLKEREEQNRPVRIGMIGGGKFGTSVFQVCIYWAWLILM